MIAFTGWSSLAHAGMMAYQVSRNLISRNELPGIIALAAIGVILVVLVPPKSRLASS